MHNLKYLEFNRLMKELQFVESDYIYQSEIIKQYDREFLKEVSDILPKPIVNPVVNKLYRKIVKSTHPDKIKSLKLNELYIEATNAYESNDDVTLYRVCSDLMIDFEWSDHEIEIVKNRILEYKSQIAFLESTYTFKWLKSTESDKMEIILRLISYHLIFFQVLLFLKMIYKYHLFYLYFVKSNHYYLRLNKYNFDYHQ